MVFYMTISGDIATNRHKRNSLVEMHRWFCNRDSCGNTPAGGCQVSRDITYKSLYSIDYLIHDALVCFTRVVFPQRKE